MYKRSNVSTKKKVVLGFLKGRDTFACLPTGYGKSLVLRPLLDTRETIPSIAGERMRDRKLVGSRQRSLSSRFILPRRERPLLAGNVETVRMVKSRPRKNQSERSDLPQHYLAI